MASGSSPFNAVIGDDLQRAIREWDNFAQRTYVNGSQRNADQFLETTINEQWQVRNKFITENPRKAFYEIPLSDESTINAWILRLLSPSANYKSLGLLESEFKNLDEKAEFEATEARNKLAGASSKLENTLSLLKDLSEKKISLTDTRFTAKTRDTNQRARTEFKSSKDFGGLSTTIDNLEKLNLELREDLSPVDKTLSNAILEYINRIAENTAVKVIISSNVAVEEFEKNLGEFNEAVAKTQDNYLNKERNQKKNEIEQLKCAYEARAFCLKHIREIVFWSDTSYAAQLQDFTKLN